MKTLETLKSEVERLWNRMQQAQGRALEQELLRSSYREAYLKYERARLWYAELGVQEEEHPLTPAAV